MMRVLLVFSGFVMFVPIAADMVLSELGTRAGVAYEETRLFRAADGSFRALKYLAIVGPLVAALWALTVYLFFHPVWPEAVWTVITINLAAGLYHVRAVGAWARLIKASRQSSVVSRQDPKAGSV
jgi:hypothetical protein